MQRAVPGLSIHSVKTLAFPTFLAYCETKALGGEAGWQNTMRVVIRSVMLIGRLT